MGCKVPVSAGVMLAVALALLPMTSSAQSGPDLEQSLALGRKLFKAGEIEQAAGTWREAFFLAEGDLELRLAMNLGIAYHKLSRYEEAYYFLAFFDVRSPQTDAARTTKVVGVLKDLTARLSAGHERVGLTTIPPDATVYVDVVSPETKYKAPLLWYFEPGKHRFIVLKPGFRTEERPFLVALGETVMLEVALLPDRPGPGLVPEDARDGVTEPPVTTPPEDPGEVGAPADPGGFGSGPGEGSSQTWAWVTLGLGLGLVGIGGGLEYLALDRADGIDRSAQGKIDGGELTFEEGMAWRDRQYEDDVRLPNIAAVACLATGGAALAAGVVWLLATRGADAPPPAVTPVVSPDGTSGMLLQMSF